MSVLASLYSGISGIVSNGSALSVAGDNIANMNTIAFKGSSAIFESNLTQRIGDVQVGLGNRLAATSAAFSQGAFTSSNNTTDLAIQGDGFFIVADSTNSRYYTRAGAFSKNSAGELVTSVGGYQLLGFEFDPITSIADQNLSAIDLSEGNISSNPIASESISIAMNLDPTATIPSGSFDGSSFAAAEGSSNFSVPATMYDSQGIARQVTTYFRKTSTPNTWTYYMLTDIDNLQSVTGAVDVSSSTGTVVLKAGTMTFGTNGQLSTVNQSGADITAQHWSTAGVVSVLSPGELVRATSATGSLDINWKGATALSWTDLSLDLTSNGNATQIYTGSRSSASFVEADGQGAGALQSLDITDDGIIRGIFTNGDSRNLYRIPLASFASNEGLSRVGSNLYQATAQSGTATVGDAGSSNRGTVLAFNLEQSNVDIATEFVKIIQFQRGFQASARTVSAAADILQDLVNLGR